MIDSSEEESKKYIKCCAIHPDGRSIIVGFEDKLRMYKILLNKLKYYGEFNLKRCKGIVYSHGGNLAACTYGRGSNANLVIVNLLLLVEVAVIKIYSEVVQIIWSEFDD